VSGKLALPRSESQNNKGVGGENRLDARRPRVNTFIHDRGIRTQHARKRTAIKQHLRSMDIPKSKEGRNLRVQLKKRRLFDAGENEKRQSSSKKKKPEGGAAQARSAHLKSYLKVVVDAW